MCKAAACSANLHQNPFLGGMQAAPRHRVTDVMPGFAVQLSQSSSHGFSLNFSPRGEAWLPALKCLRDQHPAVDTPRVLLVGGGVSAAVCTQADADRLWPSILLSGVC